MVYKLGCGLLSGLSRRDMDFEEDYPLLPTAHKRPPSKKSRIDRGNEIWPAVRTVKLDSGVVATDPLSRY